MYIASKEEKNVLSCRWKVLSCRRVGFIVSRVLLSRVGLSRLVRVSHSSAEHQGHSIIITPSPSPHHPKFNPQTQHPPLRLLTLIPLKHRRILLLPPPTTTPNLSPLWRRRTLTLTRGRRCRRRIPSSSRPIGFLQTGKFCASFRSH